jgi:hypothetical protein
MADSDKALATQIANIEKKSGKSLAQLHAAIGQSGLEKHGEIRAWLMQTYGIGHGDANVVAHLAKQPPAAGAAGDPLEQIYSGKKAHLRPIHERLMAAVEGFGDHEIAPKKGYVSLRRKKQFAMLGPKTNERFELGLNLKDDIMDARVKPMPPGGMCQYVVPLANAGEIDAKVLGYLKRAYDAAG